MSEEKKTKRDFLKEPYPWNLLHSIQAGRDIVLPEEITDEVQAGIDYVISRLEYREKEIIRRRYLEGQTLSEIGSVFGVIQERIRQIECILRRPTAAGAVANGSRAPQRQFQISLL